MDLTHERTIYLYLKEKTDWDDISICAIMGNLYAESCLYANNLQSNGNTKLCMTDEAFTKAVDCGDYTRDKFIKDGFGYGLAQWTYHTRKQALYDFIKKRGCSIGDKEAQLDFLIDEISGYTKVMSALDREMCNDTRDRVEAVLKYYEKPADQSDKAIDKRTNYANQIYERQCGIWSKKSNLCIAWECIKGYHGNGTVRKEKLADMGYCYSDVQAVVNELLNLKEVYGEW